MLIARDVFLASLERCQQSDGFVREFYGRFMASSEEIRLRFRFTDMDRQVELLSESLRLCGAALGGDPNGLAKVQEIGRTHDKYHHNIHPKWYTLWLDALVATAAEHDAEWNSDVERAWRRALLHVIDRIVSMYEG